MVRPLTPERQVAQADWYTAGPAGFGGRLECVCHAVIRRTRGSCIPRREQRAPASGGRRSPPPLAGCCTRWRNSLPWLGAGCTTRLPASGGRVRTHRKAASTSTSCAPSAAGWPTTPPQASAVGSRSGRGGEICARHGNGRLRESCSLVVRTPVRTHPRGGRRLFSSGARSSR